MNFISASIKPLLPLLHPLLMWVILALTLYTLYLGIQISRLRSANGEVKDKLVHGNFPIKHYQMGSLLLVLIILGSLGGLTATYLVAGKIILNSHLIAGLLMTGLIVVSASLSPFMRGGNQWLRSVHVTLNFILIGLFIWQASTGIQLVQKMLP